MVAQDKTQAFLSWPESTVLGQRVMTRDVRARRGQEWPLAHARFIHLCVRRWRARTASIGMPNLKWRQLNLEEHLNEKPDLGRGIIPCATTFIRGNVEFAIGYAHTGNN